METTRRADPYPDQGVPDAHRPVEGYRNVGFPWYGLDDAFTGPRWLMRVGTASDGSVEHGSAGHGDEPSLLGETRPQDQRFAVVVTVAGRPVRRSPDGTGVLEATSVSSAAWLAGSGLLSCTWPSRIERTLRQTWLEQQTALAWDLADRLDGEEWTTLTLPVRGSPTDFYYRESEYGWVLAGAAGDGAHLGAYGRGLSAYGLGFAEIRDLAAYDC